MDTGWVTLVIVAAFFAGVCFVPRVTCGILFATVAQQMGWMHFLGSALDERLVNWTMGILVIASFACMDVYVWIAKQSGDRHLFGSESNGFTSCSDRMFDDAESDS